MSGFFTFLLNASIFAALYASTFATDVQSVPADAKEVVKNRISCYVCNSDSKNDAECAGSDIEKLKPFIKVCPPLTEGPLAGQEATSCRKVLQSVSEISNTVRECAYTGNEPINGKRRTGNKGIILYIYQCFNEELGKPCNSASSIALSAFSTLAMVILALLLMS